jgi:hypothetical protein
MIGALSSLRRCRTACALTPEAGGDIFLAYAAPASALTASN